MERKHTPVRQLPRTRKGTSSWYRLSYHDKNPDAGVATRAVVIANAESRANRFRLVGVQPSISFLAIDADTLHSNLTALFVDYADEVRLNLARSGDMIRNYQLGRVDLKPVLQSLEKAVDLHQDVDVIVIADEKHVSVKCLLSQLKEMQYEHVDFHICRHSLSS
ncbi:Uncharacterised protein [BD1-7 clade bacterium]|uniref:Uncharacterized protein n=1 Tax=BD1-7 clade bacterium TaxID=2029982 RepID=A0A5S9QYJ4_9GAMM|nr:Uncharacterised protein [BD1-7 clade bacterium]